MASLFIIRRSLNVSTPERRKNACSLRPWLGWNVDKPLARFTFHLVPRPSSDSAFGLIFSHARHPGVRHPLNRVDKCSEPPKAVFAICPIYRSPRLAPSPPPPLAFPSPGSTSSSTFHPSLVLSLFLLTSSSHVDISISDCVIYHHHPPPPPTPSALPSSPSPSCGA